MFSRNSTTLVKTDWKTKIYYLFFRKNKLLQREYNGLKLKYGCFTRSKSKYAFYITISTSKRIGKKKTKLKIAGLLVLSIICTEQTKQNITLLQLLIVFSILFFSPFFPLLEQLRLAWL